MEAPAERVTVAKRPRADEGTAFELFVRDDAEEPLRHVGSVTADDAEEAYERATRLFAWYADDVWVCPAGEFTRFSTHDLDADAEAAPTDASGVEDGDEYDEPRQREL
ncbi:Htur_1727 family rSAM-partnered candidate RiPP [Halorubellus salinus]|uniref:Htur_1727 family rSAM-partnered candidate RiPP n=1 Tax=Halorubellus salinus TaxID=755309 RepID=UPI001D07CE68|nr:Htur_1727 family rSAM-partnered candidate RiPP [Halorubellus salinus]